ncbi:small muscular protein isoform X2 [Paroedura picta]|uniref:small muscular protein isoform X2 n=1 Tax=Paroedura picta TaxID=143630 RepID=UPI004055F1A8
MGARTQGTPASADFSVSLSITAGATGVIPARPETCGERMKRYRIPLQMKMPPMNLVKAMLRTYTAEGLSGQKTWMLTLRKAK